MVLDGCYSCAVESSGELPPWQRIVVTDHWRVTHAFKPEDERGPRIFARLDRPEAEIVPEADRNRLASQIRQVLPPAIGEFVQ